MKLKLKELDWQGPFPPGQGTNKYYDSLEANTAFGVIDISWKGHKQFPSYDVCMDDDYVGNSFSLDDAKEIAVRHLKEKIASILEMVECEEVLEFENEA